MSFFMVTEVTLVTIQISTLFNNPINTGNYGNLGNLGGEWGLEWCMLGRSDEQGIDYYGNLGNSGNFESNCITLKIHMRPSLFW